MRIAITQRLIANAAYPETRDALDVQWGRWFGEMSWLPLPLTTGFSPVTKLLDGLAPHGILFTGGNDLSVFKDEPLARMRDTFEAEVLGYALAANIPVVGICRGAQFLAHRFGALLGRVVGHVAQRHQCRVEMMHPLAYLLTQHQTVNSYHQMAILDGGESLHPLALAEDGSLEAFTHRRHQVLGLMWHPERETPFMASDMALIQAFFSQAT